MGFFNKNKDSRINMILQASFDHVRQNFHSVFSWLNQINQKNEDHDRRLQSIETYLTQLHTFNSQVKKVVDEHYKHEETLNRLSEVEKRLYYIQNSLEHKSASPEIKEKIEIIKEKKNTVRRNLKEKMIRSITRNSKDYIKSTILSLIQKYERVSGFKLKEIVVEEQGLCSKSSFYRILEELEKSEGLGAIREGKEKVFFVKLVGKTT